MLKRNRQIIFRVNDDEYKKFKNHTQKSGLSQEAYLRDIINNLIPTDLPPLDYYRMMNELHSIGISFNQIAETAKTINYIDAEKFYEAYAHYKDAVITITEAVMLPRKIEKWQRPRSGQ